MKARHALIALLVAIMAVAAGHGVASAFDDGHPGGPGQPPPGLMMCEDGAGVITGMVLDKNGGAAAEAQVMVYGRFGVGVVLADESGTYRVEQLCAGDYEVDAVYWNEDEPEKLQGGFYDADGDGEPDAVTLAEDDSVVSGIDIALREVEAEFPPGPEDPCKDGKGVITGTVTDADGNPVAGAEVMVSGWWDLFMGETDDSGVYRAEGLCAGDFTVEAGYWDESRPDRLLAGFYDSDGDGEPDAVTLAEDGSVVSGIDITLELVEMDMPELPPASCDNPQGVISGAVTDEDGDPVAGAEVMVVGMTGFAMVETDENGLYRAEDLCAGDFMVQAAVFDESNPDQLALGCYDADGDGEPDMVNLAEDDSTASGIDITLHVVDWWMEPSLPSPEVGTIIGAVQSVIAPVGLGDLLGTLP
jgi:hypothetical protein